MIDRNLAAAGLFAAALLAGAGAPGDAAAQTLAVVDSLARTGDAHAARETLEGWWEDEGGEADRRDVQQALWLRGLLTLSPEDAQGDFRRLTVEYPGGPFTDRALLRLARYAYTRDRLAEAARHFRTLARDHPGTPAALEAREWLERHADAVAAAEASAGASASADTTPADTVAAAAPADTTPADTAAGNGAAADTPPADTLADSVAPAEVPADTALADAASSADPGTEPDVEETGPYTVQLGAFSTERRAGTLVDRARDAGLEPRVVTVPGSDLIRVRVGRFDDAAGATRLYDRVRGLGFEATVSGDADREERIR